MQDEAEGVVVGQYSFEEFSDAALWVAGLNRERVGQTWSSPGIELLTHELIMIAGNAYKELCAATGKAQRESKGYMVPAIIVVCTRRLGYKMGERRVRAAS